jgi:uncharacterized protein YrrD
VRRAKTLHNLPVISLADGLVLGHVRDVVFDPPGGRIAGLLLREATLLTDALVIPLDKVRSLGRDAVTVPTRASVLPSIRVRAVRRLLFSGVRLTGLHILTEGGRDLGAIEEVFIGSGGEIIGYELSPGVVEATLHGKRLAPGIELITAGPDAAVFSERVVELIQQPEAEVAALEAAESEAGEREPGETAAAGLPAPLAAGQ